jgi:hypothetical protein
MNKETILKLGVMLNEKVKHHLAQLVLDRDREVV